MSALSARRAEAVLLPDPSRVVAKPFLPGEMHFSGGPSRLRQIAERVLGMGSEEVSELLERTRGLFASRHRDLPGLWERNFEMAVASDPELAGLQGDSRLLLGAYFTLEYAFEAAALTNPSIVPHPDQPDGEDRLRFVMSLRAIGEGHISSIELRSGSVDDRGRVELDPVGTTAVPGHRRTPTFSKRAFHAKLAELGADNAVAQHILGRLPDDFEMDQLDRSLASLEQGEIPPVMSFETTRMIHWLASSNYELWFEDVPLSERLLMPGGPADSQGMEDARWVRFVDDDGSTSYYATYTAYDGYQILPQLIETTRFERFRISTLSGSCAQNKGMALFPRRIDGLYTALSRHDKESIYVMRSDDVRSWGNAELVSRPTLSWEAIQVGNCGSPIETDEGWLVITHGVGPMRRYVLGALLLDQKDPSKVVGRLREPLLEPGKVERDGYVPNVVYSCGALVHAGLLVLPYGFSDRGAAVAVVPLSELLDAME